MIIATTREEYDSLDLGYYLDCENVADCKFWSYIKNHEVLGLSKDSDQFMMFKGDKVIYFVNCTFEEVVDFWN